MTNEKPQAKSKLKTEQRSKWAVPNWGLLSAAVSEGILSSEFIKTLNSKCKNVKLLHLFTPNSELFINHSLSLFTVITLA